MTTAGDDRLGVNRCARVDRVGDGADLLALTVTAPVRGVGLRRTTFHVADEPEVCQALLSLTEAGAYTGRPLTLAPNTVARLRSAGMITSAGERPRRVRFANRLPGEGAALPVEASADRRCRRALALAAAGDATAGAIAAGAEVAPGTALLVNPSLRVSRDDTAAAGPFASGDVGLGWRAEIEEPGLDVAVPFWLSEAEAAPLARLTPGAPAPTDLARDLRAGWLEAGVLEPAGYRARETAVWSAELARAHAAMAGARYTVLRDLLHPCLLQALREYFRALIAEGHLPYGDAQAQRYFAHEESVSRWVHQLLTPVIARAVPRAVRPSYVYFGCYLGGVVLEPHTDRPQCEYTLSLTLDATPDETRAQAWPLVLRDGAGDPIAVRLAPGDGLLFKGRELPHWRERLADGRTSSSLFLHFVHTDFEGGLA